MGTETQMSARVETLFASLGFKPTAFEAVAVEGGLNVYAEWNSEQSAKSFCGVALQFGGCDVSDDPDLGWTTLLRVRPR